MQSMSIIDTILEVIAPYECVVCGFEGRVLCRWCASDALPYAHESCYHCGKLSSDYASCATAKRQGKIDRVYCRTFYGGTAKKLSTSLKGVCSRGAASVMAEEMVELLPSLPQDTLITYITTVPAHIRARGFDHAKSISFEVARILERPHATVFVRTNNVKQRGSRRSVRRTQAQQSFALKNKEMIKGKVVVIVDDIITTGATLEVAANLARSAGATHVYGLIFARV